MITRALYDDLIIFLSRLTNEDLSAVFGMIAAELISRDRDAANRAMRAFNVLRERSPVRYSEAGQ